MGVQVKGSRINGKGGNWNITDESASKQDDYHCARQPIHTSLLIPAVIWGSGNGVSRRHWAEAVTLKAAATGNESLKEKIWSFSDPLPYQLS